MSDLSIKILENKNKNINLTTFNEILYGRSLKIPDYQRAYSWDEEHIEALFNTISDNCKILLNKTVQEYQNLFEDHKVQKNIFSEFSFLGSVIFCKSPESYESYELVIDGQQRITTLLMLLRFILSKLESNYPIKSAQKIRHLKDLLDGVQISRDNENEEESSIFKYINKNKINDDIKTKIKIIEDYFTSYFDEKDSEINAYERVSDYILYCINFCWILISGKESEDVSIDLFNIMNSTGEPLTGFEIFKSSIYQKDKNLGKQIEDIRNKIGKFYKHDRKKIMAHTGKLMLFLAIYRSDYEKLRISDTNSKIQKDYITKILKDSKALQEICADFKKLYEFYFKTWLNKTNSCFKYEIAFIFKFITTIKHTRVLPILCMFDSEDRAEVIKICGTFSVIWRMFQKGATGGIDGEYVSLAKELKINPNLKTLKEILRKKLIKKEDLEKIKEDFKQNEALKKIWLKRIKDVPIYEKHKNLTRFLLFIVFDKLDKNKANQVEIPAEGKTNKMLTIENWNAKGKPYDKYETIEHQIAQSNLDKIENSFNVHGLANLEFASRKFNSVLGNKTLKDKNKIKKQALDPNDKNYPDGYTNNSSIDDSFNQKLDDLQKIYDDKAQLYGNITWKTLAEDWLAWKN